MHAIYHTNTRELTVDFIEYLKNQFRDYSVDIIIKEQDDTEYLNSSKLNKQYLEQAIQEVNNTKLIQKTSEDLNL